MQKQYVRTTLPIAQLAAACGLLAVAVAVLYFAMPQELDAGPVSGRVIERVDVHANTSVERIEVRFVAPVQYVWHFPHKPGELALIQIKPVPVGTSDPAAFLLEESVPLPPEERGLVAHITYDGSEPGGPFLIVGLTRPLSFVVERGRDARSIVIALDLSAQPVSGDGSADTMHSAPASTDNPPVPANQNK